MDYKAILRQVPDFPKPGINFIDVTTLLTNGMAFQAVIQDMLEPFDDDPPTCVVGIEARGFVFGAACAYELGCGFVPIRKPGKLPAATFQVSYDLEYGTDTIEVHRDAIDPGSRVLVVDDLLATGGTVAAALKVLHNFDCEIIGCSFLVELTFLEGRKKLQGYPVHSLVTYDSE